MEVGQKIRNINGDVGTIVKTDDKGIYVSYFEKPFSEFAKSHKPRFYPWERV